MPSRAITLAALLTTGAVVTGLLWRTPLLGAEAPVLIPAPTVDASVTDTTSAAKMQTAVLAGGCFWGVQGVFEHVRGVKKVVSGYAGGERSTAQYETVSRGDTGHAESVQITYDPAQISYGKLLQIAFSVVHDPTQLNRQGPDSGTQYRSAVFYSDDDQKRVAESYIAQLNQAHAFARPVVTKIERLRGFYPAEDYHQDYLLQHPDEPYIAFNDLPKVANFKRTFPELYQPEPVLATTSDRHR